MTKFSIQIENQFGYSWDQIEQIIRKTEQYNYEAFYTCDHFYLDDKSEERNAVEAWTILSAAAIITNKIKLGTLVSGNTYRNPALLAKIASSVDHISGGRLEMGLGTGWKEIEHKGYGFDFPSLSTRFEMLEEAIQIIQSMFTREVTNFNGKHYYMEKAFNAPKPDNPLWMIGGGGEIKTMRLVAKYADYMNLPFTPMNQIQKKLDALRIQAEKVGRDYDEIGKSMFYPIRVFEDQDLLDAFIKANADRSNISEEKVRQRISEPDFPGAWMGLPEDVRDRIEYMNNLGFDYYFIQMPLDLSDHLIESFDRLVKSKYFK
ncbi:MAG: TIGR03560 family F420-dependent LLM class oxidoreductase [Candidatus Heimdallarchaeota archaeon]|nr:TIGR03560 family F420-dependent LLM class oxidoreductase [Candidatus Heimdallarchaeota archaeon]